MDIIARSLMIGKFDPTPVKEFLESLPPEDWGEFTQRQDQFDAHKATNTIAAIFPDRSNYPHLNMHQYKHTEKLMEWVKKNKQNVAYKPERVERPRWLCSIELRAYH